MPQDISLFPVSHVTDATALTTSVHAAIVRIQ
jgi:hypothetical protein